MIQILKKNPEGRTDKEMNFLLPIVREIDIFRNNKIQTHHLVDIC
jgi:hypothetical protein